MTVKEILPVRYDGLMHSGGSTKPWRIVGVDLDEVDLVEKAYVAKTFTSNNIIQGHSVAKEFICNHLAGEFDLSVPEAKIVDLNDVNFKNTLEAKTLELLATKYQGKTFASELLDASIINEQVDGSFDIVDCATLFAFDTLVLNVDRGGWRNKPNLLIDDDGFVLIDHELTLSFIDSADVSALNRCKENLSNNNWEDFYQKHIFFSRLKEYRGRKKNHLFDTFEQSLMTLDIYSVEQHVTQLTELGVQVGESAFLFDYLSTLKQKAHKFCSILLGLIS